MLTRFEVTNFKSFKEKFVFDFTKTNDYQFNPECVKNDCIKKAIIYGANGSGKSNLGFAIFDIGFHLTDKYFEHQAYKNYSNAMSKNEFSEFKYVFSFDNVLVEYSYAKSDVNTLFYETLKINGQIVVSFNKSTDTNIVINLEGAENLNTNIGEYRISIIKYVKNNTILTTNITNDLFNKFTKFIDGMLFFRSLKGNTYLGLEKNSCHIDTDIIEHNNVDDFQNFLNEAGIECKLKIIDRNGEQCLGFVFGNKVIDFFEIASTGTQSLILFYFWLQRLKEENKVSFVFIDEFDAFYHHELSEIVVKELKKIDAQVILTTHNTSIMSNSLLRPDCYFLMTEEEIKSLVQCTPKEIRCAHNLEKIYRGKGFEIGI